MFKEPLWGVGDACVVKQEASVVSLSLILIIRGQQLGGLSPANEIFLNVTFLTLQVFRVVLLRHFNHQKGGNERIQPEDTNVGVRLPEGQEKPGLRSNAVASWSLDLLLSISTVLTLPPLSTPKAQKC